MTLTRPTLPAYFVVIFLELIFFKEVKSIKGNHLSQTRNYSALVVSQRSIYWANSQLQTTFPTATNIVQRTERRLYLKQSILFLTQKVRFKSQ